MGSGAILSAQHARCEELGEEWLFDKYLEVKTVEKLMAAVNTDPTKQKVYKPQFYKWLHKTGRWERWLDNRRILAEEDLDTIQELIDNVTPTTAASDRIKIDGHKYLAEQRNRHLYGRQTEIALAVGTPEQWLEAMASKPLPDNTSVRAISATSDAMSDAMSGETEIEIGTAERNTD